MKNMIKSIVASVAMTLFASVGLASTNITFCVGETAEFTYSGSGTPSVMPNKSTPANWNEFITFSAESGKVTFQGKLDTTNEVTITLAMNGATKGPGMPSDNKYIFNVKTVEIEKTIMAWNNPNEALTFPERYDPDNKSNSTIRVVTHVLKGNITTRDPNVLFLGTRCGAHELTGQTVVDSLNALATVGNVDWYLFDGEKPTAEMTEAKKGKIKKGGDCGMTASDVGMVASSNHSALKGFYNVLEKIIDNASGYEHDREGSKYDYDYIVIETDGSRVAHQFPSASLDQQKKVAEFLAPYYADKRMIWVLDNGFDYYHGNGGSAGKIDEDAGYFDYIANATGTGTDFATEIYQYGTRCTGGERKYRVNNSFLRNSSKDHPYVNVMAVDSIGWKALLGIFDPQLYLEATTNGATYYVAEKSNVRVINNSYNTDTPSKSASYVANVDLYAGNEYDIQAWYHDAEKLGAYLKTIVKPIPFNAVIADSVVQTYGGVDDMGLSLIDGANSVRFYEVNTENWKPGDEAPDTDDTNAWVAVTSGWGVNPETMAVTATVKRIVSEWWNKIEVDIEDDGTFFAKCLATGRYEGPDENGNYLLNPNKDEATVELYDDTGKLLTKRSGAVDPAQQWEFDPRNMLVEYGDTEKTYDGIATNIWLKSGPFDSEYTSSNITKICVFSNSFDGVNWQSEEDFQKDWLVNATPASNVIWKVSALGYNTVQGTNTVTINKRSVVVESGDEDKTYDGVAATNWTAEVTSELDFLAKDKVSYKYDGTQTDAGESPNAFSYKFEDPAAAQNYNVTLVTGTLNVARAPILVVADDAGKKYGEEDPDPFTWSLDSVESEIAKGETNKVYVALSNVVELVRCPEKGETLEEDVGTYEDVITTNKPFAVYTKGVLGNYDLSFEKGDFTIRPLTLAYEPPERDEHTPPESEIKAGKATPYDYIGIYDGKKHTIRFHVVPPADSNGAPAQVRFSADGETWKDNWEDYSAEGAYKNIPTVKDCDTKVPVYVQAQNLPNYPEITNLVAYVTITQRTVYVTADSASKIYDGKELKCKTFTWETEDSVAQTGFVTGEGIASLSMTAESTITDVGIVSNTINKTTVVFYDGEKGTKATDPANYVITYKQGELEVTPRAITVSPKKDQSKCLDSEDPEEIKWQITSGTLATGDSRQSGSFKRAAGEDVGSYAITNDAPFVFGKAGALNQNYIVSYDHIEGMPNAYTFTIAECSQCGEDCPWGYKVKVIVKTTTNVALSNAATCVSGCYRKPTYRRYIGYFFGATASTPGECGTNCGCWDPQTPGSIVARVAMWNFDTKEAVTPEADMRLVDRIGKDNTSRAELVFDTNYLLGEDVTTTLTFAGFGGVDRLANGNVALKSASGFCAGTVPGVCTTCDKVCGVIDPDTCVVVPANIWTICGESITSSVTAAYGKWKMQWDAAIVSRLANGKTVLGATPADASGFTPAGYDPGVAKDCSFENMEYVENP